MKKMAALFLLFVFVIAGGGCMQGKARAESNLGDGSPYDRSKYFLEPQFRTDWEHYYGAGSYKDSQSFLAAEGKGSVETEEYIVLIQPIDDGIKMRHGRFRSKETYQSGKIRAFYFISFNAAPVKIFVSLVSSEEQDVMKNYSIQKKNGGNYIVSLNGYGEQDDSKMDEEAFLGESGGIDINQMMDQAQRDYEEYIGYLDAITETYFPGYLKRLTEEDQNKWDQSK